jgi:hypothetical protein
VLKNAYVPDWAALVKTGSDGQSQLADVYAEVAKAAAQK